ncbi:MAG TPA: secretin N-terminal domain-containing protein [Thermoanaerobaculia bacterium]
MKRLLRVLAMIVFLAAPALAQGEAAVRVYVLKHRRVEEAALLIRPHLSDGASITLTQKLNAMTVTDSPEKLDQIGKVLAAFDVAPRGYTFAIKLVRARADVPAGSIAREIGGLGAKLKSLFQFNDYALIDSAVLRGVEGGRVEYEFGGEYILNFTIRSGGDGPELLLAPFSLSRERKTDKGVLFLKPLYRASIPLTVSQTLVVGASKEEASKSALILIVLAQEAPRGDAAEKGTADAKSVQKVEQP